LVANSKKQIVPANQEGSAYSISPRFCLLIITALYSDNDHDLDFRTELDSHANSPVVGKYAAILSYTGKQVDVTGFNEALGQYKSVPVVNCSIAHDDMYIGTVHTLQIYHALYFLNMKVNLIPPFMMCLAGIHIDESPKFLAKDLSHENHSVCFEEDDFCIPLQFHNTVSYIPTRIPSTHELHDCASHEITPNTLDWNTHDPVFANEENSITDHKGGIINNKRRNISTTSQLTTSVIGSIAVSPTLTNISETFNVFQFAENIQVKKYSIKSVTSLDGKFNITAKFLEDLCNISTQVAQSTIDATTQLCVCSATHPSLSKRYHSNDRMLCYPIVNVNVL